MSKPPKTGATEPILDLAYWKHRLDTAPADAFHHSIYCCQTGVWERIEERHRQILKETIGPYDSILDAGCGYGRLLSLLPEEWQGRYTGVDLSPDFVARAQVRHPRRQFLVGDLRSLPEGVYIEYDWSILISIRPMVQRNLGDEVWIQMEKELKRYCKKLLFLEYDEKDNGVVT